MRFSFLALALLLAAGCSTAPRQAPAAAPPRLVDQMQHIEMAPANGYAFSHDGRTLIFSALSNDGMSRAYSASISGGEPSPLTDATDQHAISYFPNDDRILLSSSAHLLVRERDETTRDLGVATFLNWCSDGTAAVLAAGGLYRLDPADYHRHLLLALPEEGVPNTAVAAVSRDCRWAAITTSIVKAIYLVDLSEPQPTQRRILEDAPSLYYGVFGFTPTNQSLIYSQRHFEGFQEAYRYALADGQSYLVMQTQADVLAITFSPTGRYGVYASGRGGEMSEITDAAVVDQSSDAAVPLSANTRDLRFNRDESRIAFRLANDGWPNDIFIADTDGGHITRLVHAPNAH